MSAAKRRRVTFSDEPSIVTFERNTDHHDDPQDTEEDGSCGGAAEFVGHSQQASDLQSMQGIEDTSILEDLAEAEEEYDRPEQAFNEAGVAFEPFHLKKEREEGYFDADGNYIQYKLDEVKDAWLDSLPDGASSSSSSTAVASGQTSKPSSAPAQALELDADELLTYKRRLLDLLQPRETVLAALRRLGGRQQPLQGGADALPWKRARKSAGASRLPRPFQCSPTHVPARVSSENTAAVTPDAVGTSSSSRAGRDAGPSADPSAPAPRIGRTVPPENRDAFDRLTEYSSLLLQHGDYSVHSTPREQLVEDTDAAEAAQLQAVMGVLSTSCHSSASDSSAQTVDMGHINASDSLGLARTESQHNDAQGIRGAPSTAGLDKLNGMEVEAPAPSVAELAASEVTQEAAIAAAAEHAVPADPDEDIFTGAEAQLQQTADNDASVQHTPCQQHQGAGVANPSVKGDKTQQDGKPHGLDQAAAAPMHPTAATAGVENGFVYDESSGTWYNAAGYYYDATQGLYGDASSGRWYSYTDGAYQPVC